MSAAETRRTLRALPTMLRVGFSEVVAYRAEFVVWVFAYTMPLIMLALWGAVAREAPIGRYGEREFQAYFLATLVFRLVAASWVVWEMNTEIRTGTIVTKLLRPVHPLVAWLASQSAALPMRLALAAPIAVAAVAWIGTSAFTHDPGAWAALPLALAGAWLINFFVMAAIGSLAFFWESSLAIFDLWIGFYFVFSGYLVPLDLFPPAIERIVHWLPFRSMLSFPVELVLGHLDRSGLAAGLAIQWAWVAVAAVTAIASFQAGLRRYAAYGG